MSTAPSQTLSQPASSRLFYPLAALALLAITFIGFRLFYLHLQAYPGRPLTPPIRTLLIVHGVLMTAWMLLAVVQPFLVAANRKRVHMALGKLGVALAAGIVVAGYLVAIHATRVNPPEMRLFGLAPKEFLTVPLSGMVMFGVYVTVGVLNRRRPEVHRPLMLLASLAVVGAALGRMQALNDWYAGTWLERWFSAYVTTVMLGGLLLAVKCALEKRFDRWFAAGFAVMTAVCVAASLVAKTAAWDQFATILLR